SEGLPGGLRHGARQRSASRVLVANKQQTGRRVHKLLGPDSLLVITQIECLVAVLRVGKVIVRLPSNPGVQGQLPAETKHVIDEESPVELPTIFEFSVVLSERREPAQQEVRAVESQFVAQTGL